MLLLKTGSWMSQSVNNQFNDLSNRIDQVQTFDASGIYNRLDEHDNQIGDLRVDINGLDQQVSNIGRDINDLKDQVDNKVDKDDFLKDQQKQNDRMDGIDERLEHTHDVAHRAEEEAVRANIDNHIQNDQIADLQENKADRSELEDVAIKADGALAGAIENRNQIDTVKENLADTNKQVANNKESIDQLRENDQVLTNTVNTVKQDVQETKQQVNNNKQEINKVKNDVKVVSQDVANNSIRIQRNEERIDGAYAGIYDNHKNIEANRQAISRNSQEIQKLNKNFSDLKNTVDANRKRAAAGIAGVAAMANIPEVNSHQTFSVGVGVGGFDGQQAVAVGASARVNDNLTVKASVAANNEEVVWGAGAAFGW